MKNFVPVSIMFVLSISLLMTAACNNSPQPAVTNTEQPTTVVQFSAHTELLTPGPLTKTDAEENTKQSGQRC